MDGVFNAARQVSDMVGNAIGLGRRRQEPMYPYNAGGVGVPYVYGPVGQAQPYMGWPQPAVQPVPWEHQGDPGFGAVGSGQGCLPALQGCQQPASQIAAWHRCVCFLLVVFSL